MKKFFYLFLCVFTLAFTSVTFTSCSDDDDEEYFAGESEEDFKPNVYSLTSYWDLSGVDGLTSDEKAAAAKELSKQFQASGEYPTRAAAVAEFDDLVNRVASNSENKALLKGGKAIFTLKRGTAIIKKSTITW